MCLIGSVFLFSLPHIPIRCSFFIFSSSLFSGSSLSFSLLSTSSFFISIRSSYFYSSSFFLIPFRLLFHLRLHFPSYVSSQTSLFPLPPLPLPVLHPVG